MDCRFGLLGAGRIGKIHGRPSPPRAGKVAYVADADARRRPARWRPRSAPRSRRVDEIIAAKDVDAILIGTPTDTHADLIERRRTAGKAILCEKPVRFRSERIERLPDAWSRRPACR